MASQVDEIKSKVDIVDFIGEVVPLKKGGRNFKALCPFHQEKTPSFMVSPERQIWYCFGACQQGGDVISFLMKWENITFFEALKELAHKTGVKLETVDFEDRAWKQKEKLLKINHMASDLYHFILKKHKAGKRALSYLKDRGITNKTIDLFKLGYAPASWDTLLKFAQKKGLARDDVLTAGLLIKSESGRVYDRFRGRLTFPLADARGNIVGFSGRTIDQNTQAKYINTPETPIYHKRETLFGFNVTRGAIKKEDRVVIVEGEFDMLTCFQAGITNVTAVKGSAVTYDQLMLIKRATNKATLAFDADFAGNTTTRRTILDAEKLDFELNIAVFDFGKDPDEAVRKDPKKFRKIIKNPVPLYDYILESAVQKNTGGGAIAKKRIADEVVPFLITIHNPVVRSHYIKQLARIIDVGEAAVEALMREVERKQKRRKRFTAPSGKSPDSSTRFEKIQKYILGSILQNDDPDVAFETLFKVLEIGDFSLPSYQKIIAHFRDFKKRDKFDVEKFTTTLPKELVPLFDELYLAPLERTAQQLNASDLTKVLYECKRLSLKRKIKDSISALDEERESDKVKNLVSKLSEVEKKLVVL